jgi:hypothetical protein
MTTKISAHSTSGFMATGIDRRQAPRYSLVAIAELTDPEEGRMISGKVTQISRNECYVATPRHIRLGHRSK